MDLADTNCTFTFFLTHGDDKSLLETKDSTILVNTILGYFGRNRTLDGKPKIFIIQVSFYKIISVSKLNYFVGL